jgi:predicted acylesterase/phospholipase RssA
MTAPLDTGEDVVELPEPLTERPPDDRFCDLVLTGGVASGVVYPWAILEIARAFRFKSIGGTSVGAMAAALAAAAEYGRRNGCDDGFEVLRRAPGDLAKPGPRGLRTTMLSLFQPAPEGQRLFDLFVGAVDIYGETRRSRVPRWLRLGWPALRSYRRPALWGGVLGLLIAADCALIPPFSWGSLLGFVLAIPICVVGAVVWFGLKPDLIEGLVKNDLGLCRGKSQPGRDPKTDPGLVDWLDKGIQLAAGLGRDDAPLTFRDLWSAPASPGAPRVAVGDGDDRRLRSINLELITTNVTHGRPYRLPLQDETDRVYFEPEALRLFFPDRVVDAMVKVARPYAPASDFDPPAGEAANSGGLLELPRGDLPILVAARLSLSFPLLFSAVPLWAVDHEMPRQQRQLKRCWFSDGGLCSNFPIHLFDAAVPRWPTFGLWLGQRNPFRRNVFVWLPETHLQGSRDSWQRFDPEDAGTPVQARERADKPLGFLAGFLLAAGLTAKDWQDRSAMRLATARNRVARLALRPGEGELHIGMPRKRILRMARRYGTASGKLFVERYAGPPGASATPAWQEQRWVRLQALLVGLRGWLKGAASAAASQAHAVPMRQAIDASVGTSPLRQASRDDETRRLEPEEAAQLQALLEGVEALEARFRENDAKQPYHPLPAPELRLRTPV